MMKTSESKPMKIMVSTEIGTVSGLFLKPGKPKALMALAHGAGAGMTHLFMEQLASALADEGIATLRFQFPYMEAGKKRPDSPKVAHQTILAAMEKARKLEPELPLLLAGKSFGGRMSSQLAAQNDLDAVAGLVFYGFPLHAPGKNNTDRAAHLADVSIPMLFLQGTRDTLALPDLIQSVCEPLPLATLQFFEGADHSFKTLKRSGISHEEVIRKLAEKTKKWTDMIVN